MAPNKKAPKRPSRPTNRPVRTSRADAISRAAFKSNGGKKHVWTLLQRNVNFLLLSEDHLDLEPARASDIFNHIFAGQLVNGPFTPNQIRDDYASRNHAKRSKMYVNRICKRKGHFTREEIRARRAAVQAIENVAGQFSIDARILRPINLGLPTDRPGAAYDNGDSGDSSSDESSSTPEEDNDDETDDDDDNDDGDSIVVTHVAHPRNPRPRLPPPPRRMQRGVMDDGTVLPIGWQPAPDDYVESTYQFYRDEARMLRRVKRMNGRHTRNAYQLAIRTSTPSVSSSSAGARPVLVPAGPVATAQTHRSISQPISEPGSDASNVLVTDQDVHNSGLATIAEEDEEEEEQSSEDSAAIEKQDENDQGGHSSNDSAPGGQMLGQRRPPSSFLELRLPTPSLANSQPTAREGDTMNRKRPSAEGAKKAGKKVRRDERTQLIVNAILARPEGFLGFFLRVAFPGARDRNSDQAEAMALTDPQEVDRTWATMASTDRPLFEFANSLTSSDSPLSPSYAPRMRMFHAVNIISSNGLPLLPSSERAIVPTSDLYRHGGPALRAYSQNFASSEDILACNPAFCRVCGSEPFDVQADDLHSRPYVHNADLDWERHEQDPRDGSATNVNFFGDVDFDGLRDHPAQVRRALPVTYHDNVQRITNVCDPADCEKCMFATRTAGVSTQ